MKKGWRKLLNHPIPYLTSNRTKQITSADVQCEGTHEQNLIMLHWFLKHKQWVQKKVLPKGKKKLFSKRMVRVETYWKFVFFGLFLEEKRIGGKIVSWFALIYGIRWKSMQKISCNAIVSQKRLFQKKQHNHINGLTNAVNLKIFENIVIPSKLDANRIIKFWKNDLCRPLFF